MTGSATDASFEALLEYLRDDRGFDFTGYKRSTLVRRVQKRMADVGMERHEEYREFLEAHADEFTHLFNTILINVTAFWRDPDAWAVLVRDHLPGLLAAANGSERQIRVWSAACASGEETFTLAMMLCEALGTERFCEQVKIYATDVDEEALSHARAATYSEKAMAGVPEELRDRYFKESNGSYVFRDDLRRHVIFGRHDLVRDAPISHLDLLVSRNSLMYFNADTQTRILNRFHFALAEHGILFLGKAEMMRSRGSLFEPLDLKACIFRKTARTNVRDRLLMIGQPRVEASAKLQRDLRLRDAALDSVGAAHFLVDRNGTLTLANAAARLLFGLAPTEVGRPFQDLALSHQPVELRPRIEQVCSDRQPVLISDVAYASAEGALRSYQVRLVPILDGDHLIAVSVTFEDVTPIHRLQLELQEANQGLETAFEELQSTNEELETTNEELQSTIEELETTNEELQSTNEELETINEELQSTNEELETINEELNRRTDELNTAGAYMSSILTSLRLAVAVLDQSMDIRVWNRKAEDLWGLRAEEVEGNAFQNLDIGFPVERLKNALRSTLEGTSSHKEMIVPAVNRRGRSIQCRVTCTPFLGADRSVNGVVVLMEEWPEDEQTPEGGGEANA